MTECNVYICALQCVHVDITICFLNGQTLSLGAPAAFCSMSLCAVVESETLLSCYGIELFWSFGYVTCLFIGDSVCSDHLLGAGPWA
jgi:hypothetical protein